MFYNLAKILPECDIFFNNSKVIKARVFGKKQSGGKIELLLNSPLENNRFLVFIRGKVKIGTKLFFDKGLEAEVMELNSDGSRVVEFRQDNRVVNFGALIKILEIIGHTPLPPYIKREDDKEDERDYQSIFAKEYGSVAAPTASLHFTDRVLNELKQKHNLYYLTLHVGAGTFKPVECSEIESHVMHYEWYSIPDESKKVIDSDNKILAVGTTVTRSIESYIRSKKNEAKSNIFLNPVNTPKRVDYLLTNFHLPKSTLIMLVAGFIGIEETLRVYEEAIKEEYRFFSYGDSMLII